MRATLLNLWTATLVGLSVLVWIASVIAAWATPPAASPDAAGATTAAAPATAAAGPRFPAPLIGVGMNLYHVGDVGFVLDAVDEIAAMGFNAVQIVTPLFQENGASERVEVIEGDGRGPVRADLLAVMRRAKERGMTVSLMPQVNLTDPRGNEWRGKIEPDGPGGWRAWWESYEAAIVSFGDLAAEAEADVFVVGCELLTTLRPEHGDAWRRVIAACRSRFQGVLTYSCTWDTYGRVVFWDRLDLIGISGYWDLTVDADDRDAPTDTELAARWRSIRADLEAFAEAEGKPILITEVGWPSLPWALRDPWNYVPEGEIPPDAAAQARGYRSFVAAWGDALQQRDDPFLGVYFYEWGLFTQGGPEDRAYTFRGKPAEAVVREWLNR